MENLCTKCFLAVRKSRGIVDDHVHVSIDPILVKIKKTYVISEFFFLTEKEAVDYINAFVENIPDPKYYLSTLTEVYL